MVVQVVLGQRLVLHADGPLAGDEFLEAVKPDPTHGEPQAAASFFSMKWTMVPTVNTL